MSLNHTHWFLQVFKSFDMLTCRQQGGRVAARPEATGSCKMQILPPHGCWTALWCSEKQKVETSFQSKNTQNTHFNSMLVWCGLLWSKIKEPILLPLACVYYSELCSDWRISSGMKECLKKNKTDFLSFCWNLECSCWPGSNTNTHSGSCEDSRSSDAESTFQENTDTLQKKKTKKKNPLEPEVETKKLLPHAAVSFFSLTLTLHCSKIWI